MPPSVEDDFCHDEELIELIRSAVDEWVDALDDTGKPLDRYHELCGQIKTLIRRIIAEKTTW